jgi:hypothetical protein
MFTVYVAVRNSESKPELMSSMQKDSSYNRYAEGQEGQAVQTHVKDGEDAKAQKEARFEVGVKTTTTTATTIEPLCQHSKDQTQEEITRRNNKKSRRIMVQAFLYLCALSATWTFSTITVMTLTINNQSYYPLLLLGAFFTPLQGFFNCLIYFRYKISKCYQERQKKKRQKGNPNQQKHIGFVRQEGKSQEQFNFDEWLASRDKTGLRGLNYSDCDGNVEGKEEVWESLSQNSINNDIKPSNRSSLGIYQQEDEHSINMPGWMRRSFASSLHEADDGENDYY